MSDPAPKLTAGDTFPAHTFTSIAGETVSAPDPDQIVHLQLRRFAGCPICNLHLRTFTARHDELHAAGIREVVVFHSTDDELRKYEADLPFDVIGDPTKALYREFAVESRARSLLNPRAWPAIRRANVATIRLKLRHGGKLPPVSPTGGSLGLPADFLIGSTGRVIAAKFGVHAYDQWSVDETLAHAASAPRPTPSGDST